MLHFSLNLGAYHPLLVHFPIVLIFEIVVLEAFLFKVPFGFWHRFSFWLCAVTFFFTALAALTGWYAAHDFMEDSYLRVHRYLGFVLLGILVCLLAIKYIENKNRTRSLKLGSCFLCAILLVILFISADFGGILTRGSTPFQKREAPALEDILP